MAELWLIRHGETEWSLSGAHTGRTDIPLTAAGLEQAAALGIALGNKAFSLVLTSPMSRARNTCEAAGFGTRAEVDDNLREWDYGDYEGLTTREIRAGNPQWSLWEDGAPGGEAPGAVAARADAVIERAEAATGDVALFAHGHLLRVLTARWLGLEAACGRLFALTTASISHLGYERETRVITQWNFTISP
jgi:probable phosphoglycerate mutase